MCPTPEASQRFSGAPLSLSRTILTLSRARKHLFLFARASVYICIPDCPFVGRARRLFSESERAGTKQRARAFRINAMGFCAREKRRRHSCWARDMCVWFRRRCVCARGSVWEFVDGGYRGFGDVSWGTGNFYGNGGFWLENDWGACRGGVWGHLEDLYFFALYFVDELQLKETLLGNRKYFIYNRYKISIFATSEIFEKKKIFKSVYGIWNDDKKP